MTDIMANDNSNFKPKTMFCVIEDDISINGNVLTRSECKSGLAKANRGGWTHSYFSLGTMVYCKDEPTTALNISDIKKLLKCLNMFEYVCRKRTFSDSN